MNPVHFMGLVSKLASDEFVGMTIEDTDGNLSDIQVEPLHEEGVDKLFRIDLSTKRPRAETLDTSQLLTTLGDLFEKGYDRAICKTEQEYSIYSRTAKGVHISSESVREFKAKTTSFRFDVQYMIESPQIKTVLIELGILSEQGAIRRQQYNKLIQIKNFIGAIHEILPHFKNQKQLRIIDAACGKSYLSFVLYHFLRIEWGVDAHFYGIDTNDHLITRCMEIQRNLSYSHMDFIASTIDEFSTNEDVDILYSLHGCDTATDEAIAAGIHLNSRAIIVVPCCHFELRGQLRDHPLKGITKYGLFEERLAAIVTDSLRSLALEAAGYEVSTFRFVTDDISPKNTLLRALKRRSSNKESIHAYYELRDMFGVSPSIERLVPEIFKVS